MHENRGVPIVCRGSSSTMPGTNPLGALLAKEREEERAGRKRIREEARRRAHGVSDDPELRQVLESFFMNEKNWKYSVSP